MAKTYTLMSWNINGLRAVLKKGFEDIFKEFDADVFAVQEIKCSEGQAEVSTPGYNQYFNYAQRKGYAGTAVFCKEKPLNVIKQIWPEGQHAKDIDFDTLDNEGRLLALEFDKYWFVCVYTPNAQNDLVRLKPRLKWGAQFAKFCKELEAGKHGSKNAKPVIMTGDFNVAHNEIDLKNPKTNHKNPGFSDEERQDFTDLLNCGFVDTFRKLYPDLEGAYSWWSYRFNARAKNVGWRIDYFLTSKSIEKNIIESSINSDVFGSDHCPVSLQISL